MGEKPMRPIKNDTVPRRKALWVRKLHHSIIKKLAALQDIDPRGIIVEEAIDEYLARRPEIKAVVMQSIEEGSGG
jgi:hypothetical protein